MTACPRLAAGRELLGRVCQTCQHWHESADGECLADPKRPIKAAADTCNKWELARGLGSR